MGIFSAIRDFFSPNAKKNMRRAAAPQVTLSKIDDDDNIYDVLNKEGLLRKPGFPAGFGRHLIAEGQLGLAMVNGKPKFLAPGRYTFWSIFTKFIGRVNISQEEIKLGPISIVTVKQGTIGLSVKNGTNHILEPGRYVLRAPQSFIKAAPLNDKYIELGTHRRIMVPAGFVAIAYDEGKQIIIKAEDTAKGPYITNSPTFRYDPATDLKSVQLEEIKLDKLKVNIREGLAVEVVGLIRYQIENPAKAFFEVDDVHSAIRLQAEATLTSVFSQLSIDQISTSLSTTSVRSDGKESVEKEKVPNDLIHQATDLFIKEFKNVVEQWGVKLNNLNILSMDFTDSNFLKTLAERAQKRMEADTNKVNIAAINEVKLKQAELAKQEVEIAANAKAKAIVTIANAELEAAKALSSDPLASHLAILKGTADIASKMGDKTVFMPHGLNLSAYSNGNSQMFFMQNQGRSLAALPLARGRSNSFSSK